MTDDEDLPLFSCAMYREGGHATSVAAAKAIRPVTGKIALEVLAFARAAGDRGFTDSELKEAHPDRPESSYRKRRTELARAGYLVDTHKLRENRFGRDEIVWRIK